MWAFYMGLGSEVIAVFLLGFSLGTIKRRWKRDRLS